MSELIVVTYPDPHRAGEVMAELQRLQKEYLINLDDTVYVTKDEKGHVRLHQSNNLTAAGAAFGGMWGLLIGLLFFVPVVGAAIGVAAGALSGAMSDYGIDDKFVKDLSTRLTDNSSAIFMLVRNMTTDKVIPDLARYGGEIMQTSLSEDAEQKLREKMKQLQTAGGTDTPR